MLKVELIFDGSQEDFETALGSMDEHFDLYDSIIYQLDYAERGDTGIHRTEVGDIKIIATEM